MSRPRPLGPLRRARGAAAQCGAAILTAMLVVVLVATLASAMLWQQWRHVAVETAQRTRVQARWILNGALDWSRLILREDARQGGPDHLGEPWAVPLARARLSTFLAAERGQALVTDDAGDAQEVFLAGAIEDEQGRLNLRSLLEGPRLSESGVALAQRLWQQLKRPPAELQRLLAALQASAASSASASAAPNGGVAQGVQGAGDDAAAPLQAQRLADLRWWGLSAQTLDALEPFVTLLPERSAINLNTASPELLRAVFSEVDAAALRAFTEARQRAPFHNLEQAQRALPATAPKLDPALLGVNSRFFRVMGQLQTPEADLAEVSLLQRDGMRVTVVWRLRVPATPPDATPP